MINGDQEIDVNNYECKKIDVKQLISEMTENQ